MHPLPARRPQCFRIAILQICRQPETVGVCGPVARRLIVAGENDWRSIQLTRSMPCERRRRSVDAALCQYDRATSRRELPDVSQRQCHQVLRRSSSEKVVASALRAVVHADPCDAVHARIGPGRERRVPNGGVGRKKVNLRLSEPGTTLAQGGERWHGRGVAIEVIAAHAIQDEQHDHSRSSKTSAQDRQYTACRSRGHLHAKCSRKGWRNVLLHGRHRVHSRSHRRAHKHQRNRDVIRPRRTVHVRHVRVRPRDEVAFTWHDQELAGSSRESMPERTSLGSAVASQGWLHRPVLHAGFEVRRSQ